MSRITVADVVVDGLVRAGTPRIFGVPGGGSNLDVLEAARRADLPFVLTRGETAACIMAAVTGDLTRAPGAALTGLGPGVASAVNGAAHAFLDRSPMILLTDRHPASALTFTTHQLIDHAALLAPVIKASVTLEPASAGHWVAHALQLSMAEPRGPVHVELPADVPGLAAVPVATSCRPGPVPAPDAKALDEAARVLQGAARPVLIAGLECRSDETATWLRALAESLPAPVLVTYKAKGALPDPHPLALGLFTGGVLEQAVLAHADLVVTIGLDTVELIPRPWASGAPVLHLGRSSANGLAYRPVAEVVGDLALIIEELAPRLRERERADWDVALLDRLKRDLAARLAVATPGLAPHRVVQIARELTPAGTIATVDAGAHMFPATTYWQAVAPNELLISNGLATMGFALPAAIAAQLVHPDRRVVCLTGDGGLLMAAAELETAARLGLPIVVVVLNDGALSLIAIKQEQRGMTGVPLRYPGPDFARLAQGLGLTGVTTDSEDGFRKSFYEALASNRPALVDARVDGSGYRAVLEAVRGAAGG